MQTQIRFTKETFNLVRLEHKRLEETKKDREIEHLKRVVGAYKGWKTKRKTSGRSY